MHHPPLAALYATAVVGGTLLALDNPLRRSFVTEMVPEEDRPNAVVLYSLIVNVARIFGPALAGLLAVTVGFGWCFSIDAASYLVVLIALWMMRPPRTAPNRRPAPSQRGDPSRSPLRRPEPQPLDLVRHALRRRDARLQLHCHAAPVGHPLAAWR
jgi:MFS family permease